MSDEVTEPTVTPEEVTPEAPAVEPAADGIDPALVEKIKNLDPELLKNIDNLDEFTKRVNRKSMEAAEALRKAEAALATAPSPTAAESDDDEELDERARKIIDKRVEAGIKELVLPYLAEQRKSESEAIFDDFTAKHKDVPADAIAEKFYELGFSQTATTSAKYKDALKKAYKVAKADTIDVDALVAQKVQEQLAALKASDGEVVEVKQKKSTVEPAPVTAADIVNDPELSWVDRLHIFNKE